VRLTAFRRHLGVELPPNHLAFAPDEAAREGEHALGLPPAADDAAASITVASVKERAARVIAAA
jgi:hypothetical protein